MSSKHLSIPPGLPVVAIGLAKLLIPFVLVAYAHSHFRIETSLSTLFAGLCGVLVVFKTVTHVADEVALRRAARLSGARLMPRLPSYWPGSADLVYKQMNHWKYGYPTDGLDQAVKDHGPVFDLRAFNTSMMFTIVPEHVKLILATDFDNYVKGERFQEQMYSFLGTGVFNADGDMWKFHRAMTRPFFTKDRISHFELFSQYGDYTIQQMQQRLRAGHSVDIQDLMGRFTIDVATSFLFGSCVDTLSSPLPYPYNVSGAEAQSVSTTKAVIFAKAFLDVQDQTANRARLGPLWSLFEVFNDKTVDHMKVINAYVEPIVEAAIEKKRLRGPKEINEKEIDDGETLLDHLVGHTSDSKILKDETLNILLAGRDTTAATLTFVVYFLTQYPNVMARLRQEVLDKVGPAGKPTYDDVKEMKYLRAVINETLRLYPVVPFNVRENIRATTWPSPDPTKPPVYIPAGTKCSYSVLMMHRQKDLWGPDAEEFDPDRFLDERLRKYLTPRPFIFLPFNAGPRICLGQQFAYNSVSLMLIRLVQNFTSFTFDEDGFAPEAKPKSDWRSAEGRKGVEKFWPKMSLTTYSAGGMWIKATEAKV